MRIVIDSLSDKVARVEFDGVMVEIPRCVIPADCREGDVLGLVKLDNSSIIKEGQDRIERLKAMSNTSSDEIDL